MPSEQDQIRRVLPRGRNALDPEEVAESQRARMVEAIGELATEDGFSSITISDIVGRAGVAKAAFYKHFESKEECLVAYLDICVNQLIEAIASSLDAEATLETRIHNGLSALVEFMAYDPARARLLLIDAAAAGPLGLKRMDETHELLANFYISLREEMRSLDPSIPSLSRVRSQAIVGAIYEPVSSALRNGRAEDILGLRDELVEAVTLLAVGRGPD